jgi:drug/metabolite transporter (DMT)-like permease
VVVLGERLSPVQVGAIMLVSIGVFLIAWRRAPAVRPTGAVTEEAFRGASLTADPRRSSAPIPRQASVSVIGAALVLMLVSGVLLFIVVDATKRLGWYQPIIIDRVFQAALIGGLLAVGFPPRAHFRGHAPRWWMLLVAMGVLNAFAGAAYGFGNQHGSTALTATAASTFAAFPVVLGILLLGERPQRHQAVGIALAIAGIVALGA